MDRAYSSNFDTSRVAPVVHLKNNQFILELWHGPTAAFKDMGLQIMPLLFSEAIKIKNKDALKMGAKPLKYLILVATSGDTGKAALAGYKDKSGVSIMVFYPEGHVSQLQELQMITQEGSNLAVCAVEGDFDATQALVKDIFGDIKLNNELFSKHQTLLSSANSINWGRLIPQIVYYVSGYFSLIDQGVIKLGESMDISVPTGNFGNILAAFYAKKMGLPIGKLLCASNSNNILTEFLSTGIYDIRNRRLLRTPSPSMDILVASNIERLLYEITQNSAKVSKWMKDLEAKGDFEVDDTTKEILRREFYPDYVSNKDCLSNIKNVFDKVNYLIDPHTSVAQLVAERYVKKQLISSPVLICATAHWSKFAKDIYLAFSDSNVVDLDEFEILKRIKIMAPGVSVPKSILELKGKSIRNIVICNAKNIKREVINFANSV